MKILKWIPIIVLSLVLIVVLICSNKQYNYNLKVKKEYKADGDFSNIGKNNIHFKSSGSGNFTFVLISGLGETMNTWSKIKNELQKRGKVFMYDRSGLGHLEAKEWAKAHLYSIHIQNFIKIRPLNSLQLQLEEQKLQPPLRL